MRLKIRGTVSRLWASTSGRDSKTCRSWSASPLKSGINSSPPVDGLSSLMARTVSEVATAGAGNFRPSGATVRGPMLRGGRWAASRDDAGRNDGLRNRTRGGQVDCQPAIKGVADRLGDRRPDVADPDPVAQFG